MRFMPRQTKVVMATGRFQTLHLGSLDYLLAAKALAKDQSAEFFVCSGPLDGELSLHGYRELKAMARPLLRFDERQLLISMLLSIPASHILNNESSPHHGEPGLTAWVNNFLKPLAEHDLGKQHRDGSRVTLALVLKASDFKVYRPGDRACHYTDYLIRNYPRLGVEDVLDRLDHVGIAELGSSDLGLSLSERAPVLPAVMLAAEIILASGRRLTEAGCRDDLARVAAAYGRSAGAFDAVYALLRRTTASVP